MITFYILEYLHKGLLLYKPPYPNDSYIYEYITYRWVSAWKRNSIANALVLRLSRTNPLISYDTNNTGGLADDCLWYTYRLWATEISQVLYTASNIC